MNIIFISPECTPFAQDGSLADFIYRLSREVEKLGHNVKVFIPRYGSIDPAVFHTERLPIDFKVRFNESTTLASAYKGILPDSLVSVFLVESQNHFSNSKEIYLPEFQDEERFKFFCASVLEVISKLRLEPDIIHLFNPRIAHLAKLLRSKNIEYAKFREVKIVFTINDLKGINERLLNISKDAINLSDFVTTISPAYAYELLSDIEDFSLTKSLVQKKDSFCGILSGIDEELYNPETDSIIAQNYSKNYFSPGKKKCKEDLIETVGLSNKTQLPIFGLATSLENNFDIVYNSISQVGHSNLQLVILEKGNATYSQELNKLASNYTNIKVCSGNDLNLTRKVYAGSDFFLNLTKHEPDGSSALIGMRYGSIPVAYATGAIKDIVLDVELGEEANGITFKHYKEEDFLQAITKALKYYKNKEKWTGLVKEAMSFSSSALGTAKKYVNCYERTTGNSTSKIQLTPVGENVFQ